MKKAQPNSSEMRLYNTKRQRLYINKIERKKLLDIARILPLKWQALLLTLIYTGCRASEILELTPNNLQHQDGVIAIRSLKKRHNKIVMREVPIPDKLCHLLEQLCTQQNLSNSDPYWPISRKTVWRQIKRIMNQANIEGAHASPKGLRHGFGIHAIHCGIDLATVQKWMGHSKLSVTAIYTNAIGQDERARARLMW